MGSHTGNAAKVGIGATPTWIAGARNIQFDPGERTLVETDQLGQDVPELLKGSKKRPKLTFVVERDKSDVNGQEALITAYKNGTSVQVVYAPEGNTLGNTKITGTAYVSTPGNLDSDKDKTTIRTFTMEFSGDYGDNVFS
ncbi:MAG: hypothetical protein LWW75_07435 [Chlorobiales bacterium]|nr:hypothetical protein [Chlorobiales bacterium]